MSVASNGAIIKLIILEKNWLISSSFLKTQSVLIMDAVLNKNNKLKNVPNKNNPYKIYGK